MSERSEREGEERGREGTREWGREEEREGERMCGERERLKGNLEEKDML